MCPVTNTFAFLAADPSYLAALLVGRILPECSLLAENVNLFLRGP